MTGLDILTECRGISHILARNATSGPQSLTSLDITRLAILIDRAANEIDRLRGRKDQAYEERNRVVALLSTLYPSGVAKTDIEGWNPEWHRCVYIDFPWGQASWHFHDGQAHLFAHLPLYEGEYDGHTTEEKYAAIERAVGEIER